jgi:drug/metabolite transporter (DMT)-like permease
VSLAGVLAALGAAACYAGSYVYARRLLTNRGTEPLVLSAAQLTVGALMVGAALPWIGSQSITLSSTVVLSVVALGVLSTGIAYVLNYRLIQDEGPTAASMTNYLAPVVAVLLGVAFVDEPLSWNLVVGTAVVLVGVWIAEHNPDERGAAAGDTLVRSVDGEAQARERIR